MKGLGFREALEKILGPLCPLPSETVPLDQGVGRVASRDLYAKVDVPSLDVSLMDGFAVQSSEVGSASSQMPVQLEISGVVAAGNLKFNQPLLPRKTVRVLTGAPVPKGADAVIAEESVQREADAIRVTAPVKKGCHILAKGSDVAMDQLLIPKGRILSPGLVGYLAAAGHDHIPVTGSPRIAIVATGDEVQAPGQPAVDGKVYASNIVSVSAWCRIYGWQTHTHMVPDDPTKIAAAIEKAAESADALITSGGAWKGDRDYTVLALEQLGWEKSFHRIRIIPGKAVGYGVLAGKPVFVLPGGPPANMMGFLQIALPGLHQLAGYSVPGLPKMMVRLSKELVSRPGAHPVALMADHEVNWTQFVVGTLEKGNDIPVFCPIKEKSRLSSIAKAQAIVEIPEGADHLPTGAVVSAQCLASPFSF
jgi:molybdopterin molybdotransferase